MMQSHSIRQWVKARETPFAQWCYDLAVGLRCFSVPVIPGVHAVLYRLHVGLRESITTVLRIVWFTPLFQSRLEKPASHLHVYSGMPLILGPVCLRFGDRVRISGHTTISGRASMSPSPILIVGDNVDIGWQTTIAVGRTISIGNNVRIAGRAFLAGYPGHPLDAAARACGAPDTDDQVGDIILEEDVWLATGVTISAGVRIGRGTVVAAGSVVTKDLPPDVLAAGVPARVVRQLGDGDGA